MASTTPASTVAVVTDAATLEEVIDVLKEHIPIEMEGDFQPETLFEILVHAASNAESIEQTSKTLDASPTGNDVRYHLSKLDDLEALEEQLNEGLRSRVPRRLQNSRQKESPRTRGLKNLCRIRTTTKNPVTRLLYVGIAFILVNLWVFIIWTFVSRPRKGGRQLFQALFPLRTMLQFLRQVVERKIGVKTEIYLPVEVPL